MLPFCNGNAIMKSLTGGDDRYEIVNEDYAHYLRTTPITAQDPWLMRLLPASIRSKVKARKAAHDYEQALIYMWENSPHLLEDIGVVVRTDRVLAEDHVAAPDRVIAHVLVKTSEKALANAAQPKHEPAPVAPAPAKTVRARTHRTVVPGGLPA